MRQMVRYLMIKDECINSSFKSLKMPDCAITRCLCNYRPILTSCLLYPCSFNPMWVVISHNCVVVPVYSFMTVLKLHLLTHCKNCNFYTKDCKNDIIKPVIWLTTLPYHIRRPTITLNGLKITLYVILLCDITYNFI